MTVAYRVQTVPGREAALARLLSYLPNAEIVLDDGSPVVEEWLTPPEGPWRGYIKCLTDPPDCTHLCIIQDDALPCNYFSEALERIVAARPNNPICLFVPGSARQTVRGMIKASQNRMTFSLLAFRDFVPVVAVVWPIEHAISFLDWSRTAKLPGMPRPPRSDDAVAGSWKRQERIDVIACVPSIVEHPDDQESTIGKRAAYGADKGRVAALLVDGDPREIEWR